MPANFGSGINQSTTQDITAIMSMLYRSRQPNDQDIQLALSEQKDLELGYTALKDLPGVKWIGEKTGQNDLVIASTLVMEITHASSGEQLSEQFGNQSNEQADEQANAPSSKQRYVLTVALDHDSDIHLLNQIIRQVALRIRQDGPLPAVAAST